MIQINNPEFTDPPDFFAGVDLPPATLINEAINGLIKTHTSLYSFLKQTREIESLKKEIEILKSFEDFYELLLGAAIQAKTKVQKK